MNREITIVMTAVDVLIAALLVYVLIVLFRHIPEARRAGYLNSLVLMTAGVSILLAYLLVDLSLMHLPPQWLPAESAAALNAEIHLNWDWIIILIGFATVSLGINYLLNFANPRIVHNLNERLTREFEVESELNKARKELETQFKTRSREIEKSEAAATKAHEIIRNTLQNMEQGIIMLNADGEVMVFNDRFLEFSRMTREDAEKCLTFEDFVRHSKAAISAETKAKAIQYAKDSGNYSYEAVMEDGIIFDIRQRGIPGGGMVRTYTNITGYKKIEAELREVVKSLESATDIMRTTLENMGQGILMVDNQGQIVTYNEKVLDYLSKDRDAVKESRTLEEFFRIGEVDEAAVKRAMKFSLSREKVTYELTALDGTVLEVRQNPLEDGGWVRTYTNITDRKRIENELRDARDQANASNKAKASFLATMSHEIRTPMNGIIGMVDLLSGHDLNTDQRHIVRTIRDSGYALLTIINDILDLSKIEAGKLELELIEMSVSETVDGVTETLSTTAEQRSIRLITFVDPVLPDRVIGDPVRLRQILFNLVSNAIKFSEEGSDVLVLVEPGDVSSDPDSVKSLTVRFTVTDQGLGMSKETQKLLFQAFTQAEASTTRKYGGSGLGLSICHRLVEMMLGKISVRSREGEGSSFFVDLPFKPAAQVEQEVESPLNGLRVLLAGANTRQCQAAESYLLSAGADCEYVSTPGKIITRLHTPTANNADIDIIVLFDDLAEDTTNELQTAFDRLGGKNSPRRVSISCMGARGKTFTLENGNVTRIEGNPLHRWKLIKAVGIAAGRASPFVEDELEPTSSNLVNLPLPEVALEQGTLILVAEDNAINQDVIRRQLNQLGYQCELAGDGSLALSMWKAKQYGIILTDCHMPEMDGYQLTRAIRDLERQGTRKRTPIIAITANALSGEAERCLAVGMDGYLSKPFKMKTLQMALAKLLDPKSAPPDYQRKAAEHSSDDQACETTCPVIDDRVLKDEFGDDDKVFKEILADFLVSAEQEYDNLKATLKKRSANEVASVSHKMKSACRIVGALSLAKFFEALEQAGLEENWEFIDEETPNLDALMDSVKSYIDSQ